MHSISIISINLNNKEGLNKTISSVLNQSFTDYQYIIIDGGSTDGSSELIKSYSKKITYWVSEKDGGIYNAMNKGIKQAGGEYLLFLNSGDCLFDKEVLKKMLQKGNHADIIYGNILLDNGKEKTEGVFPEKLLFSYFFNHSLPHACSLIKRSLFENTGLYNEDYKIVSDWEFFLLAINKYQCSYQYVPIPVTVFNLEGISAREENQQLIKEERKAVLQQHFASFMPDYEAYEKLQNELPKLKGMLAYRLHNKINKMYSKFLKA